MIAIEVVPTEIKKSLPSISGPSPETLKKYSEISDKIGWAAREMFGLEIPEDVSLAWKTTFKAICNVDLIIDSLNDSEARFQVGMVAIDYLQSDNSTIDSGYVYFDESVIDLKNALIPFPQNVRDRFIFNLKYLMDIVEKVKHSSNIKELATMTRIEGQSTARLLISLLPSDQEHSQFKKWLFRLGRFGNLLDTFVDLNKDEKNGLIPFKVRLGNRLRLMWEGTNDMGFILKNTPLSLHSKFIRESTFGVIKDLYQRDK